MASSDVLVQTFIDACWAGIDVKTYINPRFSIVLDSRSSISALFQLADVSFCCGLQEIILSLAAPSLGWFESLSPVIPKDVWGIYVLVLKNPGYDPLLYIGSGTSTHRGVRARVSEHWRQQVRPACVRQAENFGYEITHITLLAWCPIPSPGEIPRIRTLIVALEAIFSALFWTFIPSKKSFGLSHLCAWDRDGFEWLGLCSHSPLKEWIRCPDGEMDFTPEQLEDIARITREKNAQYQEKYQRELRANPTDKYKQRQKTNNIKQQPGTKARQEEAIKNKTYHCEVCDVSCRDNASLVRHNATPRHQKKLEMGDDDYRCSACNISFRFLSNFNQHKLSKGHISRTRH